MPRVYFAERLRSVAPPDGVRVPGLTLRMTLDALFAVAPLLRSYVLDERGALRGEIAVEIDRQPAPDLQAPVAAGSDVFILSSK